MILRRVIFIVRQDFITHHLIDLQLEDSAVIRRQMAEGIASTLDKRGGVRLWCRDEDGWTWQEARVEWRRTK